MKDDTRRDDTANDSGPERDQLEPEVDRLLGEAFRGAGVPRSVRRKIQQMVREEWSESPAMVERPARADRRRARTFSAVAVAAAALVMLGVLFSSGARSYAWAEMLNAIAGQGVIQLETGDGIRWLALATGVVGERRAGTTTLLDSRRQVVLTRRDGEAHVVRRGLAGQPSDDRLLAAFLLGDVGKNAARAAKLRMVDESWQQDDSLDSVSLRVRFAAEASDHIVFQLWLDPDSKLPQRYEVSEAGTRAQTIPVSYSERNASELRDEYIPGDLAIVDADSLPSGAVAATGSEDGDEAAPPGNAGADGAGELPSTSQGLAAAERLSAAPIDWGPVDVGGHRANTAVDDINALLEQLWTEHEVIPSPTADDEEILRRAYLDLAGRTPTVTEVRKYLGDDAPDRYEQLVERLLSSADHASHLATVWRTFLIPEGVDLSTFGGVERFDRWLADQFARGTPYDEIVSNLLLAEGRLSRSGPLLFYSAVKLDPEQLASRASRVFLGMRLECAQCHDHPFEPWLQQDFWGFAAFFAQISRPQAELESVSTVMRVRDIGRGEVRIPDSDTIVAPKFLDQALDEVMVHREEADGIRRRQLAEWLTDSENPYFARATANRVWGHMFGKGIVDPIDDFGIRNQPKSPELLELLAAHFIESGFDLRELFRVVASSRGYRLSSGSATNDDKGLAWFGQMHVKTLSAEQVYDCITVATMLDLPTAPDDMRLLRFNNSSREQFLRQFRTPVGRTTEYHGGIPQALMLMNGALIESATGLATSGLLKSLEAPFFSNRERIEVLYLATLSRRPRPSEWRLLEPYAELNDEELREGLADLLWILLNSSEFTMNH